MSVFAPYRLRQGITAPATTTETTVTVLFDGSASVTNNIPITDYAWDFGDGNTTNGPAAVVSHDYATSGSYTVTLTITDSLPQTDVTTLPIVVAVNT